MTPAPLHALLSDAKGTWSRTEIMMKWFTKLVTTFYGWSDGIIRYRQNRANEKYKIQKAEEEAMRIMEEQRNRKTTVASNEGKIIERRALAELDEDLDFGELLKMLEDVEY